MSRPGIEPGSPVPLANILQLGQINYLNAYEMYISPIKQESDFFWVGVESSFK